MKANRTPEQLIKGICFACLGKCEQLAYCHEHCAIALAEEKDKRIKEAWSDSQRGKGAA